jgi:cytochrome c-type biogenesis protein CcmH
VTAVFWGLVAFFAVAALAFVLPALAHGRGRAGATDEAANLAIYRDQLRELDADLAAGTLAREQYDEARRDLERRMLEDLRGGQAAAPARELAERHGTAIAIGVAVPLLAALLYFAVGNPGAISSPAGDDSQSVTREQIENMVSRLAARMKENPDDPKGWVMLGRSYAVLDRYPEAVEAYANAVKRSPPDAQLLADYADVIAMTRGRNLLGEPERLIAQALKIDPDNVKALLLAGTVAFEKHDFKAATAHWERLLTLVPAESDIAASIRDGIEDVRKLASTQPKARAGKKAAPAPAAVSGTIRLAPAIAAKAAPGDTVFIFARAVSGPRVPLAVARKRVSDLPAAFRLDDSMAMSPAAKLSDHPRVVIGARVSKSGKPVAQPGDLEGLSAPVDARARGVTVVIDREVPAAK